MKSLFIADLHLSPSRPDIARAFNAFLEGLPEGIDKLFILGDLFEIWIGDDDPSDFAQSIIQSIRRVSDSGIQTYFQGGNRDFMIGRQFCEQAGCQRLPDFLVQNIHGHKILLTHGDLLCTDDLAYQRYRRRIQFPPTTWVVRRLPLKTRQKLGARIRSVSLEKAQNKSENIMDVNADEVISRLKAFDCQIMIHGHTHRPKVHEIEMLEKPAKRFTLGDWGSHVWWVQVDSDNIELRSQPIDQPISW